MERRLNFEGMISHLFLQGKQPNEQIGTVRDRILKFDMWNNHEI